MPDSNISDNAWAGFSPADANTLFGYTPGNFDTGYGGGGWQTGFMGNGAEGFDQGVQPIGLTRSTPEMLAAMGFSGPGTVLQGEGDSRETVTNPDLYSFMTQQGQTYAERYNGEDQDSMTGQVFDKSGAPIKGASNTWKLGNDDAFGIAMLLAGGLVGGAAAGVGAAGAGGGGAAAEAGAGAGAGVGGGAGAGAGGGLASSDLSAIFGPAGYGEGATAAELGGGGAGGADLASAGGASSSGGSSPEKAALYGSEGYGPAASPAEMAQAGNGGGIFSQLFGTNFGFNLNTARQGYGLMQAISALYGLSESNKIKRQARGPGMTKAGMDAVQRSMAAQGYQGSGNMAAAIERYGAESNRGDINGQTQGLSGQLSSLGLLTGGLGTLFGWGKTSGGG